MNTVEYETGSDSESIYTLYPEDSASNIGSNDTRFGAMSGSLISPTGPGVSSQYTVLPGAQILEPRQYQPHRSPIEEPTVPHFLGRSTPCTFLDTTYPFTYGHRSSRRENSIVIPTPRKFVRFAISGGEHMWPFDDVDYESESVYSDETGLSSAFQTIPDDEEQYQLQLLGDPRGVSQVVYPWGEEVIQNAPWTATSKELYESRQHSETDLSTSSHSLLCAQGDLDSHCRDALRTAKKRRPQSQHAKFYLLPHRNVNGPSRSFNSLQSASASDLDQDNNNSLRNIEVTGSSEPVLSHVEHVTTDVAGRRRFHPRQTDSVSVSPQYCADTMERDGVQTTATTRSRRNNTTLPRPQHRGGNWNRGKDENKWWLDHPLNRAGLEQAIPPDTGVTTPSFSSRRNGCVFPEVYPQRSLRRLADTSQESHELLRARTEQIYHTASLDEENRFAGRGQMEAPENKDQKRELKYGRRYMFPGTELRGASMDYDRAKINLSAPRKNMFKEEKGSRVRGLIKKCVGMF